MVFKIYYTLIFLWKFDYFSIINDVPIFIHVNCVYTLKITSELHHKKHTCVKNVNIFEIILYPFRNRLSNEDNTTMLKNKIINSNYLKIYLNIGTYDII